MDEKPSLKKDAHIVVRVRQKQKREVEEAANVDDLTLSDFVRDAILTATRRTLRRRAA